jgi:molybdopterin-containing oxidoreductase family membrane subunit
MTKIATANKQNTRLPLVTWIVLAVIGLGGLGTAWGLQLAQGMGITGLGQQVVWGLYIAGFFTAMGTGAALVTLTAISEFSGLLPLSLRRSALILALVSFVIGALLITMDVGNPINLWRILTAGRFTSMLTWDFLALLTTGVLSLAYLIVAWKPEASTAATRTFGVLAAIGAALVVIVEGWMLATMAAHPLWHSGLTVVSFLVLALLAGFALAILAWKDVAVKLTRWLKAGLWIALVLIVLEVLTPLFNTEVRPYPEVSLSLTGALSPMFWVMVIGGVLLPLAILLAFKDLMWVRVAAALALLGVVAEKLWLLAAGQTFPWQPLPAGFYMPTWIEWLALIGAIALTAFLYLGVTRLTHAE